MNVLPVHTKLQPTMNSINKGFNYLFIILRSPKIGRQDLAQSSKVNGLGTQTFSLSIFFSHIGFHTHAYELMVARHPPLFLQAHIAIPGRQKGRGVCSWETQALPGTPHLCCMTTLSCTGIWESVYFWLVLTLLF